MKTKVTKTKAQRILAAMRNKTNHGKTASEIAAAADVDHNHVYLFEKLVATGHLKRNGGDGRQLEGFDRKFRGGRGTTYLPGRNFEAELPGRTTITRKVKTKPAKVKARTAVARKVNKEVAAEAAIIGGEANTGNTIVLDVPATLAGE